MIRYEVAGDPVGSSARMSARTTTRPRPPMRAGAGARSASCTPFADAPIYDTLLLPLAQSA